MIYILTIPGIGTKQAGYSKGLEKEIKKFSKGTLLENNFTIVETRPFNVTEIDEHQTELFNRLDTSNKLGGILSLRKFVVEAFGDAVTFERNPEADDSPYKKVHRHIRDKVEEEHNLMIQDKNAKLVIVAASMGVQVLSTYIWDADNGKGIFKNSPATPKNNLRSLNYFVSIGCNLPLFVSGLPESKIVAFDKRNENFIWQNYYDKDDVLGWPLKQLSPSYNMVEDFQINTGLYAGAHVRYWEDNDFTKPFVKKMIELL
ncbi:MAG: hypothetical protein PF481_06870 [Bacteroidales bacterium]|jgi:hypothetical protein|nr:hypothetical protein [Bacteroidales bacterium]